MSAFLDLYLTKFSLTTVWLMDRKGNKSERAGKNGTQIVLVSRLLLRAAGAPPYQGFVTSNENTTQGRPTKK